LFDLAGANGAPATDNLGIWIQHASDTTNVIDASDAIDPIVAWLRRGLQNLRCMSRV
jgi:hypothetical protein